MTKPALRDTEKEAFLACLDTHREMGTLPKFDDFKINQITKYLPETVWKTETFKDHNNRDVLFGVGAHWNEEQRSVRYECRLKYGTQVENKLNLQTIDKAEQYFVSL
jgi:hypothetical protein